MFDVETAVINEIVRANKVDCPFIVAEESLDNLKDSVQNSFNNHMVLPTLWRLHKMSYSSEFLAIYEFQVFNAKKLSWETPYVKIASTSEWKKYFENIYTIQFNRGRIQYDTLINNAKEFLKNEEGCVIYEATTTPEWRTKE